MKAIELLSEDEHEQFMLQLIMKGLPKRLNAQVVVTPKALTKKLGPKMVYGHINVKRVGAESGYDVQIGHNDQTWFARLVRTGWDSVVESGKWKDPALVLKNVKKWVDRYPEEVGQ